MRLVSPTAALVFIALLAGSAASKAAVPSDQLLPATTKGYLSIPNVETLQAAFDKTQWGQLIADPVMKPFAEDLKRQLREKWTRNHEKLGLTWDDIQGVPGGEVGMAKVEPDPQHAVTAIVVDVTGKLAEAHKLLGKVHANLTARNATRSTRVVRGQTLIVYTLPRKVDQSVAEVAVFFLDEKQHELVACDDVNVMLGILRRMDGPREDSLSRVPAYRFAMERCRREAGGLKPHLRWFIEPFGYVEVQRISHPERNRPRGHDMLTILKNQGFDCIQGLGGFVNFSDGEHDVLHRTMIYAPPVKRAPGDKSQDKYNLAARMLHFPNGGTHLPPNWIPRDLATFDSVNADLRNGFEYSKTLVNAMADDEIFEDVLRSLEIDPKGPRVNIRKEVVAHLGQRVLVFSDYELPITTKSERLLVAIEVTDQAAVANAVRKLMENDPNRVARKIGNYIVWDVREDKTEMPKIDLDIDFGKSGPQAEKRVPQADRRKKKEDNKPLASKILCMAHGYLLISTHVDLIRRVIEETGAPRQTLSGSVDYELVHNAMQKLGASNDCCQTFSRTDEEYRPTYELLRAGEMPQSQTLMGKLLNGVFKEGDDDEDEEQPKPRQQQIDGRKLPEYEQVRRYLGPAGIFVSSDDNGWFATGFFLSKQAPLVAERP